METRDNLGRRITFVDRLREAGIDLSTATITTEEPTYYATAGNPLTYTPVWNVTVPRDTWESAAVRPWEHPSVSFTLNMDDFDAQLLETVASASGQEYKPSIKKKVERKKDWDEMLTPDCTKELDEFLSSFAKAGSCLSPAT